MEKITTSSFRTIINHFADEIHKRKERGPKPSVAVIDFRHWGRDGIEQPVYYVPIELLRYRKDNGRISSDIMDYEKNHGRLMEDTKDGQEIIRKFLEEKDREKTEELKNSIKHDGQREPAIITCDGFLINGNRRKMVLEMLNKQFPNEDKYKTMKVVILPGKDDEGGPPTLLDIERLENKYQLQSDGKAEYYNFDKALSLRRKIEIGMTLREQLLDDPTYASLQGKELDKAIKEYEREYLKPIECIDRYLQHLKREGLYACVSGGKGDPEGRWEAFHDYSKFWEQLKDESNRIQWDVSEREVGKIEDAAFKVIRKREIKKMPKVHMIMRNLPKYVRNTDAKKELLKLNDIEIDLPREERFDKDGNEYDEREIDRRWGAKHETIITKHVKNADQLYNREKDLEAPITKLETVLELLNHRDLEDPDIYLDDLGDALKLSIQIRDRAHELEQIFYRKKKTLDGLKKK